MALQHRAVRLLRELQSLELAVHVNLAQRTVSVATMLLGLHEPSLGVCRRQAVWGCLLTGFSLRNSRRCPGALRRTGFYSLARTPSVVGKCITVEWESSC